MDGIELTPSRCQEGKQGLLECLLEDVGRKKRAMILRGKAGKVSKVSKER